MKPVRVTFHDLDDDGRGIGTLGAGVVHVAGVLPGESGLVHVDHKSPHKPQAWGHLVGPVESASSDRTAPACAAHGRCGGCALQHMGYPAQLRFKAARAARALGDAGFSAPLQAILAAPTTVEYRNRAKYVVGLGRKGECVLGSFAPASHDIVPMPGCRVPELPLHALAEHVTRGVHDAGIAPFDHATSVGELRGVVVRRTASGALSVVVVTASEAPRDRLTALVPLWQKPFPTLAQVTHNVQPGRGGAVFGESDTVIFGPEWLPEQMGTVELHVSPRAFTQVNREQAARMYVEIAAHAVGRVVDLYCGVGGIALTIAKSGQRVCGVESHAPAVHAAQAAAIAQGLPATFHAADAVDGLSWAQGELGRADTVIVNPPRTGLLSAARAAVVDAAPDRILYVSCNPDTLARDLKVLVAGGYAITAARPVDLMPGTPQVETWVRLDHVSRT